MFILIEIQCKDWEHNKVNAGFIRHLKLAFPNELVKLYGDSNHIKGVEDILYKYGVRIQATAIEFFDYHENNEGRANEYASIIERIIGENPMEDQYVFLSCNKGILLALSDLSSRHHNIKFEIILHSALEETVARNDNISLARLKHVITQPIKKNLLCTVKNKTVSMKECLERCVSENCRFLVDF